MSLPDRLTPAALSDSLGTRVIGRRIIVLERTGSTNDFLRQMLTPELPEGVVVFAEEQTAGRGQRANRWHSAPRLGLWFSILLRPKIPLSESARLTNWAANAVAATIRQLGLEPFIKPPNDVYVQGRKVCGILVEAKLEVDSALCAIAGIGLNVNQSLESFPDELRDRAGSLAIALGRTIDRVSVALALLRELDCTYPREFSTSSSQRR